MDKKTVASGLFWKLFERIAAQGVSLIVSIVLARLLLPSDYGAIALVTVFISIANVFMSSGFATSLIQKKNADSCDFSTVFYFGLIFSVILYIIIWFSSIAIADFYKMPILKPVLRVLALGVPFASINSVQQAYVSREMIFKKFFFATLIGTIVSAIVGIIMAYSGYGIWSLVGQNLTMTIINTFVLWITVSWKPTLEFSLSRLNVLFSYGWKLLIQSLIVTVYANLRSLLIGKIYTANDLAYYNKGSQFPDLVATNIDTAMSSALFPAMSVEQSNIEKVRSMTSRSTRLCSYFMFPILLGLIVVAPNFITILLTEKWISAVPYVQILCIALLFRPAQTTMLQAIKALGRSDIVLKYDMLVRVIGLLILIFSIKYGVIYMALSEILITMIGTVIYAFGCDKVINYNVKNIFRDCTSNLLISIMMAMVIFILTEFLNLNIIIEFAVQIIVGVLAYLLLSFFTRNDSFIYIINELKLNKMKRRNNA